MKLTLQGLANRKEWLQAGFQLPTFDYPAVSARTRKAPCWIHFGCGNIFRAFQARMVQELLDAGVMDRGVTAVSGTNPATIRQSFAPYDNLSILVTLGGDGTLTKTVVGSIMEALPALARRRKRKRGCGKSFPPPPCRWHPSPSPKKATPSGTPRGSTFPKWNRICRRGPDTAGAIWDR